MKKAVILSNHFRSFNYIYKYLQDFWGEDTDFFISTWDHDYGYFSIAELEIKSKHLNFDRYHVQEILTSDENYIPLNQEKLKADISKINPYSAAIYSVDDFFEWVSHIKRHTSFNKLQLLHKYGQLFITQKGMELINKSGNHYDVVFRSRMDNIPYLPPSINMDEEILHIIKRDNKPTIGLDKLRITAGFPFMQDRLFFGSQKTMTTFFENIQDKINFFIDSGILDLPHINSYFYTHKTFGILLMLGKLSSRQSNFRDAVVRKDSVLSKVDLYDWERIRKLSLTFDDIRF